jgi:hypothetical protein
MFASGSFLEVLFPALLFFVIGLLIAWLIWGRDADNA